MPHFAVMMKWYRLALFNLVVLAALGLLLRYKISFPLEIFEQKNILHAHSHFAFSGWLSFILQLLVLNKFTTDYEKNLRFWHRFFTVSTVINYGMIVSFIWVGYTGMSIALSTLTLFLSYIFIFKIFKALPLSDNSKISVAFLKASLWFLVLSSLGSYALALVIATKSTHQYWYHNALYFFLHFQYNGWFTFAVLAFFIKSLERSAAFNLKHARRFFMLLAVTCIPSYLFTSLWHQRPIVITTIIIITAVVQTCSLYYLFQLLYKNTKHVFAQMPVICKWLYSLAILAFVLKILLQLLSGYPQLGQLAFGFRPIIIGYLHLIFLAFITMYLIALLADLKIIDLNYRITSFGLITFAAGIIINEILLAIQGLAAISYIYLPQINLWLFGNTFILLAGAILLFIASGKKDNATHYSSKSIFNFK